MMGTPIRSHMCPGPLGWQALAMGWPWDAIAGVKLAEVSPYPGNTYAILHILAPKETFSVGSIH